MADRPPDSRAPRAAIVVDHPERDLPGIVLTALDLARHGIVCHLVPMNLQAREIWALAPDFVLLNYLRRSNEPFARELQAAGIAFGGLDTEGAVWPDPDEYISLLWRDRALLRAARCVCMWGARLADDLVARELFTPEQIVVTGCPRFDLYTDPWRVLREDAAEALHRRTRRILINTNFSVSNPKFTTADKCQALHQGVLGYSRAEVERMVKAEAVAIREIVRIAGLIADTWRTIEVVIRPHPFEDPAPYTAAAIGRRNLTVNQSESIQAAIFGACAVIQRSCTTAIEAGLAGVPAFSPQWIPAPMLMPDAEAVSVPCHSFAELSGHLATIVSGSYRPSAGIRQAIASVIRDCCFAADGCAHRRVSAAVCRVVQRNPAIDRERCRRLLYGLEDAPDGTPPESHLARAARHARHRLRLSPDWSFLRMRDVPAVAWMASGKHFDAATVQRLVDRARLIGSFASREFDDVVVQGEAQASQGGGGGEYARYGVVIAPRRLLEASTRTQFRPTSTTHLQPTAQR